MPGLSFLIKYNTVPVFASLALRFAMLRSLCNASLALQCFARFAMFRSLCLASRDQSLHFLLFFFFSGVPFLPFLPSSGVLFGLPALVKHPGFTFTGVPFGLPRLHATFTGVPFGTFSGVPFGLPGFAFDSEK
jgi:hypothetical protein